MLQKFNNRCSNTYDFYPIWYEINFRSNYSCLNILFLWLAMMWSVVNWGSAARLGSILSAVKKCFLYSHFSRTAITNQRAVFLISHTSLLSRSEPPLNCVPHIPITWRVHAERSRISINWYSQRRILIVFNSLPVLKDGDYAVVRHCVSIDQIKI